MFHQMVLPSSLTFPRHESNKWTGRSPLHNQRKEDVVLKVDKSIGMGFSQRFRHRTSLFLEGKPQTRFRPGKRHPSFLALKFDTKEGLWRSFGPSGIGAFRVRYYISHLIFLCSFSIRIGRIANLTMHTKHIFEKIWLTGILKWNL